MDEESLAAIYMGKLETEPNAALVLTQFLFALHDREINAYFIGRIGRMARLSGKKTVFYSICETAFVEDFDLSDPNKIGLLIWFCQRKLEKKAEASDVNLKDLLKKKKKEIPKRKLKLRSPFND